jgi:hypothetical protein
MSFIPSFSTNQTLGVPTNINLTDTSTGTDSSIAKRRVIFTTSTGTNLVPTGNSSAVYIDWDIANPSISINVLKVDMALTVLVEWLDVSNNVLYSVSTLEGYTMYNETFYYGLTQNQVSTPDIVNDTNYYNNKSILRTEIDSGNQAILYGNDITSAQNCYSRATYLVQNQNLFF